MWWISDCIGMRPKGPKPKLCDLHNMHFVLIMKNFGNGKTATFFFLWTRKGAGRSYVDYLSGCGLIGTLSLENVRLSHNYCDRGATDLTLAPQESQSVRHNPLLFTGYLVIVLINTNTLIIFYHFLKKKIYVHNNNIMDIYFFLEPKYTIC